MEGTNTLPLPIELRERIYKEFIHLHVLKEKTKKEIQYASIAFWIQRFHNGCKKGESSIKMYNIQYYINLLIRDIQFDNSTRIGLLMKLYMEPGLQGRDTSRWEFHTY